MSSARKLYNSAGPLFRGKFEFKFRRSSRTPDARLVHCPHLRIIDV